MYNFSKVGDLRKVGEFTLLFNDHNDMSDPQRQMDQPMGTDPRGYQRQKVIF